METRQGPRVSLGIKVISKIDKKSKEEILLTSGDRFEGNAYDINIHGIGIFTKYFLPQGLILKLEILGMPFGLNAPIKVRGEVRHCNYVAKAKYKCGIKFLDLPAKQEEAIAKFISTFERRKKPRIDLS